MCAAAQIVAVSWKGQAGETQPMGSIQHAALLRACSAAGVFCRVNVCQAVRAVRFIAGRSVSGGRLKAEHRPDRLLRSWSRTAPVDMSCLERISPQGGCI